MSSEDFDEIEKNYSNQLQSPKGEFEEEKEQNSSRENLDYQRNLPSLAESINFISNTTEAVSSTSAVLQSSLVGVGDNLDIDQPLPKRARLQNHSNNNPESDYRATDGRSNNISILMAMEERNSSVSSNPEFGDANETGNQNADIRSAHNILNLNKNPSPRDFAEFLEDPHRFHPSFDFIQTTFIDVSFR